MLFAQAFFQLPLRRLILLTTNPSVDVLPSLAAIAAAITAISSSSEVSSSSSTGAATTGCRCRSSCRLFVLLGKLFLNLRDKLEAAD